MDGLNFDELNFDSVTGMRVEAPAAPVPPVPAAVADPAPEILEACFAPMSFPVTAGDVVDAVFSQIPSTPAVIPSLDLALVRPKFDDFKREAVRIAADAKALVVCDDASLSMAVALGGLLKKNAARVEIDRKASIADAMAFVDGVNKLCAMITDPLVTKKNARKEILNPECAENLLKTKMVQHQAKQELERQERERKARAEAAALQRRLDEEAAAANRIAAEVARKVAEEEQRVKREKAEAEAKERGAKDAELAAIAAQAEVERLEAVRIAAAEAKANEVVAPSVVAPVVQETAAVTRTESGSAFNKRPWVFTITNPVDVPLEYLMVDEKKIREAVKNGVRFIAGVKIEQETQINFKR